MQQVHCQRKKTLKKLVGKISNKQSEDVALFLIGYYYKLQ